MSNETVHEYKVKLRADRTYDLYVDGNLMATKGSVRSVIKELAIIMMEVDDYIINKTK